VAFAQHRRQADVREWNTQIHLRDGSIVVVSGEDFPTGWFTVTYPATGQSVTAADPNDYLYPDDVRLDAQSDLLYTRAEGLSAGMWQATWLYKYDLHGQKILERLQIKNGILPPLCPDQP
jgi:hypothetical protein